MKKLKFINVGLATAAILSLAACGKTDSSSSAKSGADSTVASSQAAESSAAGSSTTASSSSKSNPAVSSSEETTLMAATLYCVGDSTMCNYLKTDGSHTDNLYYPRYGYATQLDTVFNTDYLTINNLAISGRSSLNFLSEANYTTLKNSIKAGDYLLIGFGHNDEKYDDSTRFTYPALDAYQTQYSKYNGSNVTNFQYNLYENYIKLAKDAGATPILATPIVRLKDDADYTGNAIHQVSGVGDYTACILDLAEDTGTAVVDLTSLTATEWTAKNSDAVYYHSMGGKYDIEDLTQVTDTTPVIANPGSADHTHINVYGAKEVSYLFASNLPASCSLSKYVKSSITAPTKENDLVSWPNYKPALPTTDWYKGTRSNTTNFTITSKTTTSYESDDLAAYGWNATAFGTLGTSSSSGIVNKGFIANETKSEDGTYSTFTIGQTGTSSPNGKITSTVEGLAILFQQIDINYDFTLEADVTVATVGEKTQQGFGIALYDAVFDMDVSGTSLPNVVAGGLYAAGSTSIAKYWERIGGTGEGWATNNTATVESNKWYSVNDTAHLKLQRIGQNVDITVVYNGETTTHRYQDISFDNMDNDYCYAGFIATRGTTITIDSRTISFTIDKVGQGA